jgi:hypothetical protein
MHILAILMPLLAVACFVGFVWLVVVAFRRSVGWGLAVLFLSPIAAVVLAIKHWRETRTPFLIYAGSMACAVLFFAAAAVVGIMAFGGAATQVAQEASETAAAPSAVTFVVEPESEDDALEPPVETTAGSAATAGQLVVDSDGEALTVASWSPRGDRGSSSLDLGLPPMGDLSPGDAERLVGYEVRIVDNRGQTHVGTLEQVSGGKLVLTRHLSSGTFSYKLDSSSISSLRAK